MQPSFAILENLISYEKCPCVPHGLGNTGPFYTFTMKTIMFPSIFLENLLVSYIPAPTYVRHVLASTCRCDPSILVLVPLLSCFSHVWLFATPWTVTHQAPLSIEFSRQEYWSGLPCPSLGVLPDPGMKPRSLSSPALAGRVFCFCFWPTEPPRKPIKPRNNEVK